MKPAFTITDCGAEFSPCRTWRYSLFREWARVRVPRMVAFCGLNPSKADESTDDNTVRRCIRYAHRWGFDGMWMLNAFGLRSTDPQGLLSCVDPIGPDNDAKILAVLAQSNVEKLVVCWGKHASLLDRGAQLLKLLRANGHPKLYCLGRNGDGSPKHPLYLPNDARLEVFE